jgi:heavy metal sensor kinase
MLSGLTRHWSLRVRLTLLFLAIFGSTLILFSSLLYRNFVTNQQNEFDIALYNHAVDISQGIKVGPFGNFVINSDLLSTGGKIFPFSAGSVYIQILTLDGVEVGRSRNLGQTHLPLTKKDLHLLYQTQGVFETIKFKDLKIPGSPSKSSFRVLTALSPGQSHRNFILQVAVPETLLIQVTHELKQFLWFGIPLALIIATFGGLYLSYEALGPVRDMIKKANQLSPHRLSERVPVPPAFDELRSLALTLNALLDRLQRAFESQERFIADASHELKTPLAIMRGELEVFKSRPRSSEETGQFLNSELQELQHLSRVVEDLLILARVDAGSGVLEKSPVHLEEIVIEVASKLESLARQKQVKIRLLLPESPLASVYADSDLIRILIKNLVENAIKYSPPENVVEVKLDSINLPDSSSVKLNVTDFGPGIPKEMIPKIFERFFRGKPAENSQIPGAGLGLAIAHRIAEIHESEIQVDSTLGVKTTFSLQIKSF